MFVLEYKVKPKPQQIESISEAIKTTQLVRNKVLRFWMDNRGVGKTEIFRYNTALRKEYKFVRDLNSHATQVAVERVLKAINRFFANCKKQVKSKKGNPKFQKNNRSVEYKKLGGKLSGNIKHITFTDKKQIGTLKLIGSRELNYDRLEQIKRVRIIRRANGYYVQYCINLDLRDTVKQLEPTEKAVGIDLDIKYFSADSQRNIEAIPQFYRKAEKQLNRLNRRKSKKLKKGKAFSKNYLKARARYANKHLKVSRQREEFAKRVSLRLIQFNDLIADEDLNVSGMVKSRLAKSINDSAWSLFSQWLEYFADKYGKIAVAVPPHNKCQNCSNCGVKVKKTLSTKTHVCPHCGYVEDRDINAAINILKKALLMLSTVGRTESQDWGDDTSTLIGEILLKQVTSMNQESSRL